MKFRDYIAEAIKPPYYIIEKGKKYFLFNRETKFKEEVSKKIAFKMMNRGQASFAPDSFNEADKVAQAKIEVLRFKLKDIEANMIKAKKEKDKEKFKTLKQQALETKLAIVDLAKG